MNGSILLSLYSIKNPSLQKFIFKKMVLKGKWGQKSEAIVIIFQRVKRSIFSFSPLFVLPPLWEIVGLK